MRVVSWKAGFCPLSLPCAFRTGGGGGSWVFVPHGAHISNIVSQIKGRCCQSVEQVQEKHPQLRMNPPNEVVTELPIHQQVLVPLSDSGDLKHMSLFNVLRGYRRRSNTA